MVRVWFGEQIPAPHFNLNLTPHLNLKSFVNSSYNPLLGRQSRTKVWKPWFTIGGSQKGGFQKDSSWQMFLQNENRNEGTFGCSPGTTRVRSHVPPDTPTPPTPASLHLQLNQPPDHPSDTSSLSPNPEQKKKIRNFHQDNPKNLLRLFLRNDLQSKNNLKNCHF